VVTVDDEDMFIKKLYARCVFVSMSALNIDWKAG
jgi:hypothetical protein